MIFWTNAWNAYPHKTSTYGYRSDSMLTFDAHPPAPLIGAFRRRVSLYACCNEVGYMTLINNSLSSETILLVDHIKTASDVISQLSAELAVYLGVEQQRIEQAIVERESTRTTALANGAALPHCRLPDLKAFGIAIMVLTQPVRWDNEGHAVDTVMMIAGPTSSVGEHLRILANGSQLLDSQALRAKLKKSPDPKSARKLLAAAEQAIEQRRSAEGMLRELRKDQANGGQVDYLADVAERFEW